MNLFTSNVFPLFRSSTHPAMRHKHDLPQKTCPVCLRPFAWRKKWERVWAEVTYCSERCRRAKNKADAEPGD